VNGSVAAVAASAAVDAGRSPDSLDPESSEQPATTMAQITTAPITTAHVTDARFTNVRCGPRGRTRVAENRF